MSNQEIINNIESSFKKHFPNGYINIYNRDQEKVDIQFYIGLIGNKNDINNGIRENDPMHHLFVIRQKEDKLIADMLFGGLSCKPTNPLYAMDNVKTKFRKTTGDSNKICTTYDKWFKKLKELVIEQGSNIYKAEVYQKYI